MQQATTNHRLQRGFSLVELMIGTALSMMIVGAVLALLLSTKVAYNDTDRLGALTESGRYTLQVLSEQLRHADFWGAIQASDVQPAISLAAIDSDCSGAAAGYALTTPIWATTASSATVASCITDAAIDSDVLFIKHVAATATALGSLDASRTYIMANNITGIIFDGADTTPSTAVGGDVPNGSAREYLASAYYVSTSSGTPTLFRKRLLGNTWQASEEVSSGIEMVRVEFGEDTNNDGTADRFVAPDSAAMNDVVSARLFVLARTQETDNGYTDSKTYYLGNTTVTPNDHYHRMVFQTTVNLRNRYLHIVGDPAAQGS